MDCMLKLWKFVMAISLFLGGIRDLLDQRVFVWKLLGRRFRVHQYTVDLYVEDATAAANQFWIEAEGRFEFGGQTDRRGLVVSDTAVFNACLVG
jgi:hypothetical protein